MFVLRVSRSFTAIITRRIAFGDQPSCPPFELGSRVAITKRLYELAGGPGFDGSISSLCYDPWALWLGHIFRVTTDLCSPLKP